MSAYMQYDNPFSLFCSPTVFLQLELLVDWSKQISEAEHFLSQHGVVHRDMKMENVVLSRWHPESV